jgi:2-aminoadipate transaminase
MEACGARFVGVEMDESGMLPDRLEETLKSLADKHEPIKFIYVIPEFQNPSGRTMDVQRRRDIIEVAKRFDFPILEDQPYRELRYNGEPLPTIWELAKNEYHDPDLVSICKSFSKILGPGMRLGYTIGPTEVVGQMVKWAQKITVSPDCTTQRVAARFIEKGHMKGHIEKIIDLYRPRRDAMLNALATYMPETVKWTHPEGGMFIWVTFPDGVNTDDLLVRAVKNKVAFIPGSKFYPGGIVKKNELRLNFSYTSLDLIEEGVKRLSALL